MLLVFPDRTLPSSLLSAALCCSTVDDKDFCFILFSRHPYKNIGNNNFVGSTQVYFSGVIII
jgi:hypothetical protein